MRRISIAEAHFCGARIVAGDVTTRIVAAARIVAGVNTCRVVWGKRPKNVASSQNVVTVGLVYGTRIV